MLLVTLVFGKLPHLVATPELATRCGPIGGCSTERYRLQFKSGPPHTPYHGVNPPSTEAVKEILDIASKILSLEYTDYTSALDHVGLES